MGVFHSSQLQIHNKGTMLRAMYNSTSIMLVKHFCILKAAHDEQFTAVHWIDTE